MIISECFKYIETSPAYCSIFQSGIYVYIIGAVYSLGMFYAWTRYTCGCDDHSLSDGLTILFWWIAIPIYHLKQEEKPERRKKK